MSIPKIFRGRFLDQPRTFGQCNHKRHDPGLASSVMSALNWYGGAKRHFEDRAVDEITIRVQHAFVCRLHHLTVGRLRYTCTRLISQDSWSTCTLCLASNRRVTKPDLAAKSLNKLHTLWAKKALRITSIDFVRLRFRRACARDQSLVSASSSTARGQSSSPRPYLVALSLTGTEARLDEEIFKPSRSRGLSAFA